MPTGGATGTSPGAGSTSASRPKSAVARELLEETGIREVELGRVIGQRSGVRFVFRGRVVVQDEWYVAGRVASPWVGVGRGHDGERDAVAGHRWWSASDLAATTEVVFPPELADLVAEAQRG